MQRVHIEGGCGGGREYMGALYTFWLNPVNLKLFLKKQAIYKYIHQINLGLLHYYVGANIFVCLFENLLRQAKEI